MPETATSPAPDPISWTYVNDGRLVAFFLGSASVLLGIGIVAVVAYGGDEAASADLFFGLGIFLLLFSILLFLPRLRSRGAFSYSLLVEHPMDVVEEVLRAALEESGRKVRVEALQQRFERPPRAVIIDGVPWKFSLRDAPYRERKEDGTRWTEIVQQGLENEKDEVARELRERVLSRLATSVPSSG